MLAPRSSNALATEKFPIVTGKVKFPESLDLCGSDY